jgi:protein TonB
VIGEQSSANVKPAETYTVIGAPAPNDQPKADTSDSNPPNAAKYTVQGETVYTASNTPPKTLTDPDGGRAVSGGVLNGRALSLPKPRYPAAARAVRVTGAVQVQVLIDEDGNVFLAQAVGGHPLLQSAAVTAACGSQFSPTLLAGQPVKVSGIITYNFVP